MQNNYFLYFEIRTDHLIPVKRSKFVSIKEKRISHRVCFVAPEDNKKKIKENKKRHVLGPYKKNKKIVEPGWVKVIPVEIGEIRIDPKSSERKLEEENISGRITTIVKLGQNTEKCSGDVKRLTASRELQ